MNEQALQSLKSKLSRWHSNNEVHARASDLALYQFLDELITHLQDEKPTESVADDEEDIIRKSPAGEAVNTLFDPAGDEGGGGNHPTDPSGKP